MGLNSGLGKLGRYWKCEERDERGSLSGFVHSLQGFLFLVFRNDLQSSIQIVI